MSDATSLLDQISESQANKETTANAALLAAWPAMMFAKRDSTSSGLTWGFYGGRLNGASVANGTLTLTASATNYIVVHRTTLAVSVATTTTNWNNTTTYGRAYQVTVGGSAPTDWLDVRKANDNTGIFDSTSTGTVTTTGSPANGNLTKFSGSTAITNGDLSGDVTTSGTLATTIAANAVTNAKAAQMAAHTFKGNNTGSTANAADLTATQLTAELIAVVGDSGSGGTKGLVPAPGAGDAAAGKFLKADGTFAVPPAGSTPTGTGYRHVTSGTEDGASAPANRYPVVYAPSYASSITIDLSAHPCDQVNITLSGNLTLDFSNANDGEVVRVELINTNGATFALGTGTVASSTVTAPATLSAGASAIDEFVFKYSSAKGKMLMTAYNQGF